MRQDNGQSTHWPPLTAADWRYELKLVCPQAKLAAARSWILQHPEGMRVAYVPRLVRSLYLDTPALNSFEANVAGVSRRQKLRLRWYGSSTGRVENPVLELKFKENTEGGKRREKLNWMLDWKRPYFILLGELRQAAGAKWASWLSGATEAVLLNQYAREYYVSPDGQLRMTLDYDLRAFDQRLLGRPNLRQALPLPATAIIEI